MKKSKSRTKCSDLKVTDKYDEKSDSGTRRLRGCPQAPGMYTSVLPARGLHHLLYEIVDNSDRRGARRLLHAISSKLRSKRAISSALPTTAAAFPVFTPQMGIPTLEVAHRPARRRQVRRLRLPGIRRSARRWFIGRKRAVRLAGGRGPRRTYPKHYMRFERGVTTVKMRDTPCESENRHDHSFHADPEIF